MFACNASERNQIPVKLRFILQQVTLLISVLVAFTDVEVDVPGHGLLKVDIGYGGAFYALVPAHSLGLDVTKCRTRDLTDAASLVTGGVAAMLL